MKRIYLRTAREQLGLTQAELAKRSGVAQNSISKLELARVTRPHYHIVEALARALDLNVTQLRFGPDPKAKKVAAHAPRARGAAA